VRNWLLIAALTALAGMQAQDAPFERITIPTGRSRVLVMPYDVTRLAVTNPAIADAVVVAPREVLIDAKGPGTTSLILWGAGTRTQYDVVVDAGVSALQQQLDAIFPGEGILVGATDEAIILRGRASTKEVSQRAAEIAQASSSKLKVINLLQRDGEPDSQQVMLQVRFTEGSQTAMEQLGVSLVVGRSTLVGRSTTGQFAAPGVADNGTGNLPVFGDLLNLFFFSRSAGVGAVLKALQEKGQLQILAEPNLVAYNGQSASFLAGGEFPYPIVNGNTGATGVEFREFGIRLSFTPTIVGEAVRLKVKMEVSAPDFAAGLSLAGYTVPGLKTRRAETDVELLDGQTFAIAGLLNNDTQVSRQAIPFVSRIPVIGSLFKSKEDRSDKTELVVVITPHLVRPAKPGEVPPLPVTIKNPASLFDGIGGQLDGGGGLVDGKAPIAKPKKSGGA
jgi:pilus assembly protein CpaC